MSCEKLTIEEICEQLKIICPWVQNLRCIETIDTWDLYIELSNGAVATTPFCRIPRALSEEEVCELIKDKLPTVVGECVTYDAATNTYTVNVEPCLPVLEYCPDTHTLKHRGDVLQLNCSRLDFDPATCTISHTDEKGGVQAYILPQDQFFYDTSGCSLTILPAKGGTPVTIPVGVPSSDVNLEMTASKELRLTYKDKVIGVQMPDSYVGCAYDRATNTLRMITCTGAENSHSLATARLDCQTLPDGTQVLTFTNEIDQPKVFNIPAVVLDTDDLTVAGSVLTFNYGGDGNQNTVIVDICQIVADNCNATITQQYDDGGFDFIDNKGQTFQVRPVNCCTFFREDSNPVVDGTAPNAPTVTISTKADRDTLILCHPNGLSFWHCDNGSWVYDYHKTFVDRHNYNVDAAAAIDPANPPTQPPANARYANKIDGDTTIVCYTNGWAAWTCVNGTWVRDWYKLDVDVKNYNVNDATILSSGALPTAPPADARLNNKTEQDTVTVAHPNGWAAWTCVGGTWVRDWVKIEVDCCHYHLVSASDIDPANPPATPPASPSTVNKNDGDTATVCYNNGWAGFTCINGAWVRDHLKVDPPDVRSYNVQGNGSIDPANPPASPPGDPRIANKIDDDTVNVCYDNGWATYTCVNGAWVLDWFKIDTAATVPILCVTYTIGTNAPVKLVPDASGTINVPIPANDDYCVRIGASGQLILSTAHPTFANKRVIELPEYPAECCTYNLESTDNIVIGTPTTVTNPPTEKKEKDTVIQLHPNGLSAFTCRNGAWALDWVYIFSDCCHYHTQSTDEIDPDSPPSDPATVPAGTFAARDTLHVCHSNGSCYYTHNGTAWVLDFCKTAPEEHTHESSDGSVLIEFDPDTKVYDHRVKCCVPQKLCNDAGDIIWSVWERVTNEERYFMPNGRPYTGSTAGYDACVCEDK